MPTSRNTGKKKKSGTPPKTRSTKSPGNKTAPVPAGRLDQLEFHRNALALIPDPRDRHPGIAILVRSSAGSFSQRFCSCRTARKHTCQHLKSLSRLGSVLDKKLAGKKPGEDFIDSVWYRLATIMADGSPDTPDTIGIRTARGNGEEMVVFFGQNGDRLLSYDSRGPDRSRFVERCVSVPDDASAPTRKRVIERLSLLTLTSDERVLADMGRRTRRQKLEATFWYRAAYHGYMELGAEGCTFFPKIEKTTGSFVLTCRNSEDQPVFTMEIPRPKVKSILKALNGGMLNQHGLSVSPIPLDAIFDVRLNNELDLEIRPLLKAVQKDGEARFFERENLERFRYGDLYYIEELGILAEDRYPEPPPTRFQEPIKTVIQKSRVPEFLEAFETDLERGPFRIENAVKRLNIYKAFDKIEITPEAIDRDWCWLSVKYGTGNQAISLAKILRARIQNQRFIPVEDGWFDCQTPNLGHLDVFGSQLSESEVSTETGSIRLSRMDALRIGALGETKVSIRGESEPAERLQKMFALRPFEPIPDSKGMTSTLRAYQQLGVEWLWFLFENRLGGLLCDEMGLGKTHQAMALMAGLTENEIEPGPFLVVCPTTVISHWHRKIAEHAPVLKAAVYHGGQRDLDACLAESSVLLTSYGVLRRDVDKLSETGFAVIFFDEIQNLKNPDTHSHKAAKRVSAKVKIGLTGTPVENTLTELKALMDLTVPGYLGSDTVFVDRYLEPVEQEKDTDRREELTRLISPFTLRRRKRTVLSELPEKIEDNMMCRLSDDQVKMYRDTVENRGRQLAAEIEKDGAPVPYMHIFALLNLLKQICNHPALVEKQTAEYTRYESGKWELFVELLTESLDGGQKVVVFSQYLGMIEIMKHHLAERNVDFVSLTGASRNRGDIIDRFQTDPDCRVYLGSLKAGGTGIDLTSASVVIHYDRWWNAAREDQATDRVHRIGQKRGVQVFKLVTEGTLEEKVAAMIDKKRSLMDAVIKEDDPGLLKTFTREQLMELMAMPAGGRGGAFQV